MTSLPSPKPTWPTFLCSLCFCARENMCSTLFVQVCVAAFNFVWGVPTYFKGAKWTAAGMPLVFFRLRVRHSVVMAYFPRTGKGGVRYVPTKIATPSVCSRLANGSSATMCCPAVVAWFCRLATEGGGIQISPLYKKNNRHLVVQKREAVLTATIHWWLLLLLLTTADLQRIKMTRLD